MTNGGHQKRRFPTLLSTTALLLIGLAIFCVISSGSGKIKIYFYSSETNINNFKSLKMEFDRYLSKFGPYEFQPFSSRDVFEKQVKGKENCLLLLSSWHYRHIHKKYALTPALTGVRNGKKYQRKILVTSQKPADIKAASPDSSHRPAAFSIPPAPLNGCLKDSRNILFRCLPSQKISMP